MWAGLLFTVRPSHRQLTANLNHFYAESGVADLKRIALLKFADKPRKKRKNLVDGLDIEMLIRGLRTELQQGKI